MSAYYNEHDAFAAAWLRNLIAADLIAPGDVDERSIVDVSAADVAGYAQCHFFAGIGVWSAALRGAGWSDDEPVWTGSCPCQPFSAAGKRDGFDDERHLWPELYRLIRQCSPVVVFGEQVASRDGLTWLDAVSADLEDAGYAVGAVDTCAAGFGAPHVRQRLYFVAESNAPRCEGDGLRSLRAVVCAAGPGATSVMGDTEGTGPQGRRAESSASASRLRGGHAGLPDSARAGSVADDNSAGREQQRCARVRAERDASLRHDADRRSATRGFWRDADWLPCIDGKARPVEPGTFPLAHGAPARVGRLRGYGNALCRPQAEAFIRAYREVRVIA